MQSIWLRVSSSFCYKVSIIMKKLPIIEFHILQSFPVSCLNRDDVGAPKTAIIGGVERLRVSSQCWKRSVRQALHEQGVKLGLRTKKVNDNILAALQAKGAEGEAAEKAANVVAKSLSDDSLLFMTDKEYEAFADYVIEKNFEVSEIKSGEIAKIIKKAKIASLNGLDIALFGRMVAKAPVMNVEAAAAFSHAISTHNASPELDFFTAMDDMGGKDDQSTGAGHMGTTEYGAATYYRYISLNLNKLVDTLGIEDDSEAIKLAIGEFVKALYTAVPTARQATMSAACPWGYANVLVRHGQRMQCAFEKPVRAKGQSGYLEPSIDALKAELSRQEKLSGSIYGKVASFEFGINEDLSIDDLIAGIAKATGV